MQIDIEFLCTSEEVAFRETDLCFRTIAPVGASDGIGFDIEIVGFVERTCESEIKGVSVGSGRELEIRAAEDTRSIDLTR